MLADALKILLATEYAFVIKAQQFHWNVEGPDFVQLHEFFGNTALTLVLAHLALLVGQSVWRKKNLALPMLTGRIEGKGPDLVPSNRVWLAALLLLSVLGYWVWEFFLSRS